jgi:hypothetical protein
MRWRRIALVAGILVVAGGISAASWGLFAYNQVTKVDRSDPEVVTDEYLRAALVRKDTAGVDLYTCADKSGLVAIQVLRDDLDEREKDFGVTFVVSWGAYVRAGDTLTTDLTLTAMANGQSQGRQTDVWRFTVKMSDGWRVCGAERVAPLPSPTPPTTR